MSAPSLLDEHHSLVGALAQQTGQRAASNPHRPGPAHDAWHRGFMRAWCAAQWKVSK